MSNVRNINSLATLRERRREILAEQETAQKGLTSTLAEAPAKAKDYALEDLALPALGIGLAAYVGYRIIRSGKSSYYPRTKESEVLPAYMPRSNRENIPASPPVRPDLPAPAPQPVATTHHRPVQPARPIVSRETKKSAFNLAALMSAGKLLIPAAQAIIGVVQSQQTKQQTKEQLAETKEHIEAVVE